MSGLVTEMEFEALPELRAPQAAFEKGQVIIGKPRPAILQEALDLIQKLNLGPNDANKLTDALFFKRHPERAGRPLTKSEGLLIREWSRLRKVALAAISITFPMGESEQFFGALANLARRGAGWLTAPGSPQRRAALTLARQAINRGLPALGQRLGVGQDPSWRQAASWLGDVLPQQEYEWQSELEVNPARKIYPDAMLEHLGHAAAETHSEAEAEALTGAMVPLAARIVPPAAPVLMRATPGLVCGLAGVVRGLRRDPATRPLVRVVPAIVRGTAASIAQKTASGVPVTPQAAVRALAGQTLRVLGSPQSSTQAFRRSRVLDRQFHRSAGDSPSLGASCPSCGAKIR
jgi:hypothetical protein